MIGSVPRQFDAPGRWWRVLALVAAIGAGVVSAACSSDTSVATGPSQLKCQVNLAVTSSSIGPDGGTGVITVTAAPECPWDVSSAAEWLTGLSPTSGQGNGTVQFRVMPNPQPSAREGEIVVNESRLRVSQPAACRVTLGSGGLSIDAGGGSREFRVSAPSACTWTAASDADWITVTTPASHSGDGSVGLSIAPHQGRQRRVGTVSVADQRFTVTQEPAASGPAPQPGCVFQVGSSTQGILPNTGGEIAASVTTAAGCDWTAASQVPWITVVAGAAGSGSGAVTFSVAANPGGVRSGTVTVAGQIFTLTQAARAGDACTYAIAPAAAAIVAEGGTGGVTVTAPGGCAWSANSHAPWITVTGGASGAGNGTVSFSVAANPGSARSGSLTIAGQTFTVTQAARAADPCTYAIGPTEITIAADGGSGTLAVSAGGGCAWTAVSNAPWITVTAGASGSGSGGVAFSVAANTGAARTGTISVAGRTFTVTQTAATAPCTYALAPPSAAIGVLGGTGSFTVTTGASCTWTATSGANWIVVASGAAGTGTGTVGFAVTPNLGAARTGTITVGGQTFTVTQAALVCTFSISPTSLILPASGGEGSVAVTAGPNCAWTARAEDRFIKLSSAPSGTGNGTVTFVVADHRGRDDRTGRLTIAGQTFTVTQRGRDD